MAKRELYVIEFESANFCGASSTCMVWATSTDDAVAEFEECGWGEEFYREEDVDQFEDENVDDDPGVIWSSTVGATRLIGSRFEEWAKDPSQKSFYQIVN